MRSGTASANLLSQAVTTQVGQFGTLQAERLEAFARELNRFSLGLDERFERLKMAVEGRLAAIQADNANKLEEMRRTVDEKLHATLEQRLGESFKLVERAPGAGASRASVKCRAWRPVSAISSAC